MEKPIDSMTVFRPAFFRRNVFFVRSFSSDFFVQPFYVAQFIVPHFFVRDFFRRSFVRPDIFPTMHFSVRMFFYVCVFFRLTNFSFMYIFVAASSRMYIISYGHLRPCQFSHYVIFVTAFFRLTLFSFRFFFVHHFFVCFFFSLSGMFLPFIF